MNTYIQKILKCSNIQQANCNQNNKIQNKGNSGNVRYSRSSSYNKQQKDQNQFLQTFKNQKKEKKFQHTQSDCKQYQGNSLSLIQGKSMKQKLKNEYKQLDFRQFQQKQQKHLQQTQLQKQQQLRNLYKSNVEFQQELLSRCNRVENYSDQSDEDQNSFKIQQKCFLSPLQQRVKKCSTDQGQQLTYSKLLNSHGHTRSYSLYQQQQQLGNKKVILNNSNNNKSQSDNKKISITQYDWGKNKRDLGNITSGFKNFEFQVQKGNKNRSGMGRRRVSTDHGGDGRKELFLQQNQRNIRNRNKYFLIQQQVKRRNQNLDQQQQEQQENEQFYRLKEIHNKIQHFQVKGRQVKQQLQFCDDNESIIMESVFQNQNQNQECQQQRGKSSEENFQQKQQQDKDYYFFEDKQLYKNKQEMIDKDICPIKYYYYSKQTQNKSQESNNKTRVVYSQSASCKYPNQQNNNNILMYEQDQEQSNNCNQGINQRVLNKCKTDQVQYQNRCQDQQQQGQKLGRNSSIFSLKKSQNSNNNSVDYSQIAWQEYVRSQEQKRFKNK